MAATVLSLSFFNFLLRTDGLSLTVYDVGNRESFDNLEIWFNELETYASSKDVVRMVIGNKIDEVDLDRGFFH